jgi:hypothetical protein
MIKSSCGGMASCGDCVVKIVSGEQFASSPTFAELKLLGNVFHITKERLSCQVKCQGDVTLDLSAHQEQKIGSKNFSHSLKQQSKTILKKKNERVHEKKKLEEKKNLKADNEEIGGSSCQDPNWFRHWEKNSSSRNDLKKGGQRRPRPFSFSKEDLKYTERGPWKKKSSSHSSSDDEKF